MYTKATMTKPHDLKNSRMPCVITNINRSKKVYTGCFSVTPPWEFANPQQTSMDENPKFLQAAARRFFGFSIFDGTRSKPVLMVWVPFCGQKYWGIQRGKFPWRGFPIGARSTLLAHTLRAKYSVLDLWRPLTLKRGCPGGGQTLYGGSRKRLSTSTFHAWWIASFRV